MAPKRRRKRVRSQSEKYSGDGDDDDVDDDQNLQLALRPAGAERKLAGISVEALQNGKATCIRTKIASHEHSNVALKKVLLAMQDQRNSTTLPQVRDLV
jgi:hypothetical protein